MAKTRKKPRRAQPPPARASARRIEARRATAERKLGVLERLTMDASAANIANAETITIRRVRQVIAETLAKREVDPPAGFVQLQTARLGEAMLVAHTRMMEGDLQAMDRPIQPAAERDRHPGFGRAAIAAADRGRPTRASAAEVRARRGREGNFPPRKPLKEKQTRQESDLPGT
jgi:hypothetical protein